MRAIELTGSAPDVCFRQAEPASRMS